ncbi:uncharacterized protein ARMOST_11859 [Armillaria ostoyae]|uniref:Protein kinase domain-containing protein n=1 Tax=Armillaria ostoyae TaxID=47428 RepID=A0A284RIA7_ARMOS|nr:uncharacterized protein ARMOST_11859 [Armillaria ostoyae]
MRYPDIPIMWRVFDLFRERLQIEDKLIPYIMNNGNQFIEYNSQRVQQKTVISDPTADWFKDSSSAGGKLLAENWEKGWKKLMEFDQYSARTFMMLPFDIENEDGTCFLKKKAYPNSVINWMERTNTGTGMFDTAFSEMVIDDLQFDWPTGSAMTFGGDGEEESAVSWRCLAGGSEVFINAMVSKISVPTPKIQYNKRVTSITPTATGTKPLSVTYGSEASNEYDYVISTIPLPALRFVDLDGCNLSYAQLEGLRTLRYDSSCKVGIRFSSRWWQTLPTGSIKGGQTKTDRIVRTVVFPSYGVNDLNADAVMIASYTWSQDAARVGGLINGRHTADEQFLIDNILKDLAALHGVTFDFLKKELRDWCAWEWYSDPFTLGERIRPLWPSQFSSIYPAFGQGAAGGRLLFAGEALSDQHAWVEGALDSAYEAVRKMLEGAGLEECLEKLEANWGNPYLDKAEAEEYTSLLREQELIGALFSTISDRDEIKDALLGCSKGLSSCGDLVKKLGNDSRIGSRQPVIVGRNTCVVAATSEGKELIVKISWPTASLRSEAKLVTKTREKTRIIVQGRKLDHFPDIPISQGFDYDANSTQANLMNIFNRASAVDEEKPEYERRVCRMMVQERLYPLEELWTAQEYAQVFFDTWQIHKWLYDCSKIVHRDISPGNIMWRRTVDGHLLCGVLNDFDLESSFRDERTGTLPYMAYELLINGDNGQPPKHLYRHDVESIFYLILLLCCRCELVLLLQNSSEHAIMARMKVPSRFDRWYKLNCAQLKSAKAGFLFGASHTANSGFIGFQPWLDDLHQQFLDGYCARSSYTLRQRRGKATGAFDEETVQDQVSYSVVLDICSEFASSPLVVHNDQLEEAT